MKRLDELSLRPWLQWTAWALLVGLVLLLQLFLHAVDLGHKPLWLDEASTWMVASRPLGRVITLSSEFHSQPPLYYLVLHFLLKLGSAEWFLRSFSWLCVAATLAYVLIAVEELTRLGRIALCVLYLFGPHAHFLSRELRPYGLASLAMLVQAVLFLRLVAAPSRRRAYAYAAVSFVALHSLAFDVWAFAVQALVVAVGAAVSLARRRRPALAPIVGVAAAGVLYLPFLALVWHHQAHSGSGQPTWGGALAEAFKLDHFSTVLTGFSPLPAPWSVLLVGLLIGFLAGLREHPERLVLVAVVLVHIAAIHGFLFQRSFMATRYFTPVWPIFLLVMAFGFDALARLPDRRGWVAVFAGLFLWTSQAAGPFARYRRAPLPVEGWRLVAARLRAQPGKKVLLFDVGYEGQMLWYQTRNDPDVELRLRVGSGWASGGDSQTAAHIREVVAATSAEAGCYYYKVNSPLGLYRTVFIPEMEQLGFLPAPPPGEGLQGYCRR